MRKLRIVGKWQRSSLYKKSLILFTCLLVVLASFFLIYVYNSMVIYERNLVDNYIKYLAENDYLVNSVDANFEISKYEKKNANIKDGIKKLYKSETLKIKKNSKLSNDDIYAYDLYNGEKLVSTVSLKSTNSYMRMGILKIDEWEIVDNDTHFDDGIYSYKITVPSEYLVYVNDKELDSDVKTKEGDVKGLERLTEYIEIASSKTYEINNLVYAPDIKILDEKKKEVTYTINDNEIIVNKDFMEVATLKKAKEFIKDDFDILKLAENWSLFLTDDLSGSTHGLYTLTPYLINGSYMYDMAKGWATQVDITFVSNHRLKNPVFTNEKVENFIIYNDNAFSCEVYLEKNMTVNGADKVDIMHDRLYFIYYNGGYKLVSMEAITD